MPEPILLPPARDPIIEPKTGYMTRSWILFFEQLVKRLLPLLTNISNQFLNGAGEFVTPTVGPIDAQYLVASANGTLTAERVATDTSTVSWDYATAAQAKANVVDASITPTKASANLKSDLITFVISGIATGVSGFKSIPYSGTITKVRLLSTDAAATSGSIVVDIWKDTYANYPPTVADTITAAAKPTITTATNSEDAVLTGWTTTLVAGDVLGFNVDSVTSLTQATIELSVTRT